MYKKLSFSIVEFEFFKLSFRENTDAYSLMYCKKTNAYIALYMYYHK